jgi:hypothetical protein
MDRNKNAWRLLRALRFSSRRGSSSIRNLEKLKTKCQTPEML